MGFAITKQHIEEAKKKFQKSGILSLKRIGTVLQRISDL